MAERPVEVVCDLPHGGVLAGRLWSHRGRGTESMTFAYDDAYIATAAGYELDPVQLPKLSGQQQTPLGRKLFGAFSDTAPDTWGRTVIDRREIKRAKAEERARRSFGEIDFLLGVRDDLRQGALRFREPGSPTFLAHEDAGVPVLTNLPELLDAAEKTERGQETEEDLRILTHAGSSLGGARPKAHVMTEDGRLAIAKFPSAKDRDRDVMRWEWVTAQLASAAGVRMPRCSLHRIAGRWVFVVDRFDRAPSGRVGYVSAMTMLGLADGDRASYLEIAEAIGQQSPQARSDLQQLWRRIVFTVLVSNYDDHLRNHGFLRTSTAGWTLSPAFDINPDPSGRRELHTSIDLGAPSAGIELAMSVCEYFRLDRTQALEALRDVRTATEQWRTVASRAGLDDEIERMEPAFEHEESEVARALT